MSEQTRFDLNQTDLPKQWYNIMADSPVPPQPVLHPGTLQPVTPEFLSVLFPMEIIQQEVSSERFIDIPDPVREVDKPFLMSVEDVFSITGRGTVATGRCERGVIKVGEDVEIVGLKDT